MDRNGYFICTNCKHYQHTTEFGMCEECGKEDLMQISKEAYNNGTTKDVKTTMLTKEFLEGIRALKEACTQLAEVWDSNHDDSLELCHAYPFDCSFDELTAKVGKWRDEVEACFKRDETEVLMMKPQEDWQKKWFNFDGEPTYFEGFTTGKRWNGWACPTFTKVEADKIMSHMCSVELKAWYDADNDRYIFQMDPSAPPFDELTKKQIDEQDLYNTFEGSKTLIDGQSVVTYAIGWGCWIWDSWTEEEMKLRLHYGNDC